MDHNLITPFIVRANGVIINYVPKSNGKDPSVEYHCILFDQCDLWTPLKLNGVFSYFHTIVPTERELNECEKFFLTPDSSDWNPQCQSYEINECSMIYFEGNMSETSWRSKHQVAFEHEDH